MIMAWTYSKLADRHRDLGCANNPDAIFEYPSNRNNRALLRVQLDHHEDGHRCQAPCTKGHDKGHVRIVIPNQVKGK